MRLWLMLGMVLGLAGCPAEIRPCAKGTVFVTVELVGTAVQSDTLVVDLSIDGGPTKTTSLALTSAVAKGGVQIEFPQGYPLGHTLAITITATQGGVPVATRSATVMLDDACEAISLQLGMAAPDLLIPATVDLLGADGAKGADGAIDDLSIASDLLPPLDDGGSLDDLPTDGFVASADLTCVGTIEDCFNGVDDDCDGLVDCADFECTGGTTPVAECIPDPGVATVGTKLPGSGACPSSYPTSKARNSDFVDSTCGLGNCDASGTVTYACQVTLTDYSSTACSGTNREIQVDSSQGCVPITPIPNGNRVFKTGYSAVYKSGGCPTPTGTATKNQAKFNSLDRFCQRSTATAGGGCTAGGLCVPKADNYCYQLPGLGSCATGYTQDINVYSTGIDAQKACACSGGAFPGNCGSIDDWGLHSQPSCSDSRTTIPFATCSSADYSSNIAIEVGAPTSQGSCFPTVQATGNDTPTGTYQLCCR